MCDPGRIGRTPNGTTNTGCSLVTYKSQVSVPQTRGPLSAVQYQEAALVTEDVLSALELPTVTRSTMTYSFTYQVSCCAPATPSDSGTRDAADILASCMEQLHVGDNSSSSSSCRAPGVYTPSHSIPNSNPHVAHALAKSSFPNYRVFTFDIEATGLSPTKDAIIELAVVDVASGTCWSSLVKPHNNRKSSRHALAAHGISHKELQKPDVPTLTQALQRMWHFISHHTQQQQQQQQQHQCLQQQPQQQQEAESYVTPLLVAHNGYIYDYKMLAAAVHSQASISAECNHSGSSSSSSSSASDRMGMLPHHLMVLDTLALARRLRLKELLTDLRQATLREHFLGSPPSVAHRALADAQELAALLPHLLTWAAAQTKTDLDEKMLPRSFESFLTAAAAAVTTASADANPEAACSGTSTTVAAVAVADDNVSAGSVTAVAVVAAASSSGTSSSSSRGGGRSAAGSGRGRGRRIGKTAAVEADSSSNSSAAVAAAAAAAVHSSQQLAVANHNGLLDLDSSAAAAAVRQEVSLCTASNDAEKDSCSSSSSSAAAVSVSSTAVTAPSRQSAVSSNGSSSSSGIFNCMSTWQSSLSTRTTTISQAATAADSISAAVLQPTFVTLRGQCLPIMSSTSFMNAVQNNLSSSSNSSSGSRTGLHLGPFIPGRSDPSSGFSEVLLGQQGLPLVFLLEGLVIAKDIKLGYNEGRLQAVSLHVKCSSRKRVQQQHIKQVAAAVNSITHLLPSSDHHHHHDQYQDHQDQYLDHQQQQQQQLFSCLSGSSLLVKISIKTGAPYLDATVRHHSSSSGSRRLAPVATPNLASSTALDQLQQLLAVGSPVSLVLWPSCVWCNKKYRGVTLNCVEVWRQEIV